MGEVVAVCCSSTHSFGKPPLAAIRLLAGLGVEGDAHLRRTVKHRSHLAADPTHPTDRPVPYTGIQYVSIPEFQAIGTQVGQLVAAAAAGDQTVEQALQAAQQAVERTMRRAGYIK